MTLKDEPVSSNHTVKVKGTNDKYYHVRGPATDSVIRCLERTRGQYEHHITRFLRENLSENATIIDIGAKNHS